MKIRKKSIKKKYKKNKKTFKKRRVINKKKKKLKTLKKKGGAGLLAKMYWNWQRNSSSKNDDCNDTIKCNDFADKTTKMRSGSQSIVYNCKVSEEYCKAKEGKKVVVVAALQKSQKVEEKEGFEIQKKIYNLALESGNFDKSNIPIPEISKCGECELPFMWGEQEKKSFDNPPYKIEEGILGGELKHIIHTKKKNMSEVEIKRLFLPIFKILKIMHNKKIVHRDIKPENILIHLKDVDDIDKEGEKKKEGDDIRIEQIDNLKLIDFGFAKEKEDNKGVGSFTELCGTLPYIPPEILKCNGGNGIIKSYNEKCDMFSLGIVLYECFTGGIPPFKTNNNRAFDPVRTDHQKIYYREIQNLDLEKIRRHEEMTPEFKDILINLLREDPNTRISASDALEHSFLVEERLPGVFYVGDVVWFQRSKKPQRAKIIEVVPDDPEVGVTSKASIQGYTIQFLSLTKVSKTKFTYPEWLEEVEDNFNLTPIAQQDGAKQKTFKIMKKRSKKTEIGRFLLKKWFLGEKRKEDDETKLNLLGNKDLLSQARKFQSGNEQEKPMLYRKEKFLLKQPTDQEIEEMKAAVKEILDSETNDGNRQSEDR